MAEHQVAIELYEIGVKRGRAQVLGTLDLMVGSDLPLAMNFQVKDINNLDENTASFTKTFDIPATRNNNRVLEECFSDNLIDYQKFVGDQIKCRVKVNGLTVLVGSFQVTSTIGKEKIEAYTVTILGDANNWTSQFEKPMCDTMWDMDNDKWNDDDNGTGHYIFSSHLWKLINDNVTNCDDYNWCMPVICWGEYSHYQGSGANQRAKMWLEDNTPSIFIKPLVEKYFNELGYRLESNFFNTDYFKKLCFPLDYAYFRHGHNQDPVYHIEARFEPPNVWDSMWDDMSGNGFQNDEMFGMFLLARFGDTRDDFDFTGPIIMSSSGATPTYKYGTYADPDTRQPRGYRRGSDCNFQAWGSYDLISLGSVGTTAGGGYGTINQRHVIGSSGSPSTYNQGFPSTGDGRHGIRTYDGDDINANQLFPSNSALYDDNDDDTAMDGTLEGCQITRNNNNIPFNHLIFYNGKGHYTRDPSNTKGWPKRWGREALVNFQPPWGRGGGGFVDAMWISTGVQLTYNLPSCGSYNQGVEFTFYGGDQGAPYNMSWITTRINGQDGFALPYYENNAWYGTYNGHVTTAITGGWTTSPESMLGTDKWMEARMGHPNDGTGSYWPCSARIDSNLDKLDSEMLRNGSAEVYTRDAGNQAFFSWVAAKAGSYRFKIRIPAMMENKLWASENMKPTIKVFKAGLDVTEAQEIEMIGKKIINFKPGYDQGRGKMVYIDIEIDTGYVNCEQFDRVWVDAILPGNFNHYYKNSLIMLSEEFARRLNSQTATNPFQWDDFCNTDPTDDGILIKESFPYDAQAGKYVIPNGYFKVFLDNKVRHMDRFVLRDMLPCDVSKMDFIGGLTGLWNLHWHTDEQSKVVTVEPFDDFYRGKKDAVDWTYKKDYATPSTTSFMVDKLAKVMKFAYQEDGSDGVVEEVSKRQSQHWHSHNIELSSRFLNEEIILGTSLFAPTFMFEDFELHYGFGGGQAPWIPLIVSDFIEDMGYTTPKPEVGDGFSFRLLSYEGMQSVGMETSYGSWNWNVPHPITGNNGDVSTYPQAVSWHYESATAPNLSYSKSKNSAYMGVGGEQNGLYHDYWRGMITMLANAPRMKTAFFYLTPTDIASLDLRNIIHIGDVGQANCTYWIVSKVIDYQPHMDTPTAVELIQYQPLTNDAGIVAHADDGVTRRWQTSGGGSSTGAFTGGSTGIQNGSGYQVNVIASPNSTNIGSNANTNNATIMQGGQGNTAPANAGITMFGNNLQSNLAGQIVMGQWNEPDNEAILVIGGGTSDNDRRNLITVRRDGQVQFGGNGGGSGMVTTDENGNYVDMYTEIENKGSAGKTIGKVIK